MEKDKNTEHPRSLIDHAAMESARYKANIAKWGVNIAIFLFTILITIIILISQGIGISVVAPLAIFGLVTVWFIGWRRWNQLYQRFYTEELLRMEEKPAKETISFLLKLSSQEIEILNYMAQGYFNKQIGFELNISESTVKSHITSILNKLNASARTEAVVIAIKHGLIAVR